LCAVQFNYLYTISSHNSFALITTSQYDDNCGIVHKWPLLTVTGINEQ